jgi:hypothetical protein
MKTARAGARSTNRVIHDPSMAAGMALALAALMDKVGLTEFTMDPNEFPIERLAEFVLERTEDNKLIVRI